MLRIFQIGVGEYTALCRLDHPNIVKYYDVITIADRRTRFPFSAILTFTELCYCDLFTILDELSKLTWQQTRRWFTQITRAVAYMHSEPTGLHSIVHLDIKPENIMFKFPVEGIQVDEPTLLEHWDAITFKLGDFGTSAYLPRINDTDYDDNIGTLFGTEPFIAPKLIDMFRTRGPPVQAKQCDVHSLSMTLANSMMVAAVLNDVGDAGQIETLMYYCSEGEAGVQMAGKVVRDELLKARNHLYSMNTAILTIQNLLDEPGVARLIYMMIIKQPQLRQNIQWVLEEIEKL